MSTDENMLEILDQKWKEPIQHNPYIDTILKQFIFVILKWNKLFSQKKKRNKLHLLHNQNN